MGNNKYKILIVEDEANIRSFIKANLETSDYQVLCAETCELGMMMYASHHPDLILLDLGLPDRDGMSLIQEVRETDTVPIIVLSARSNERDKVEALEAEFAAINATRLPDGRLSRTVLLGLDASRSFLRDVARKGGAR